MNILDWVSSVELLKRSKTPFKDKCFPRDVTFVDKMPHFQKPSKQIGYLSCFIFKGKHKNILEP